MFYKVKEAKAMENFILYITFENGEKKYYDVKNLFDKWAMFEKLKNEEIKFSDVKVDKGGYGISWHEEIDISCNELWESGKENI